MNTNEEEQRYREYSATEAWKKLTAEMDRRQTDIVAYQKRMDEITAEIAREVEENKKDYGRKS